MKFSLDIPDSLHQKIIEKAKKNHRAIGSQYIVDLESVYGVDK